jgi:hypothetical protein
MERHARETAYGVKEIRDADAPVFKGGKTCNAFTQAERRSLNAIRAEPAARGEFEGLGMWVQEQNISGVHAQL